MDATVAALVVDSVEEHLRACGWELAVAPRTRSVSVRQGPSTACLANLDQRLADVLALAQVTRDVGPGSASGRVDLLLLHLLDALAAQAPGARLLLSGSRDEVVLSLGFGDGRDGAVPLGRGPGLAAALGHVARFLHAMPATGRTTTSQATAG